MQSWFRDWKEETTMKKFFKAIVLICVTILLLDILCVDTQGLASTSNNTAIRKKLDSKQEQEKAVESMEKSMAINGIQLLTVDGDGTNLNFQVSKILGNHRILREMISLNTVSYKMRTIQEIYQGKRQIARREVDYHVQTITSRKAVLTYKDPISNKKKTFDSEVGHASGAGAAAFGAIGSSGLWEATTVTATTVAAGVGVAVGAAAVGYLTYKAASNYRKTHLPSSAIKSNVHNLAGIGGVNVAHVNAVRFKEGTTKYKKGIKQLEKVHFKSSAKSFNKSMAKATDGLTEAGNALNKGASKANAQLAKTLVSIKNMNAKLNKIKIKPINIKLKPIITKKSEKAFDRTMDRAHASLSKLNFSINIPNFKNTPKPKIKSRVYGDNAKTIVTGKTLPKGKIDIEWSFKFKTVTANSKGIFRTSLTNVSAGDVLYISATGKDTKKTSYFTSKMINVKAMPRKNVTTKLTIGKSYVGETRITGQTVPGAKIYLNASNGDTRSTTAAQNGNFSIKVTALNTESTFNLTARAKNTQAVNYKSSRSVTVDVQPKEIKASMLPRISKVISGSKTFINGSAQANASIHVTTPHQQITGKANAKGIFKIPLKNVNSSDDIEIFVVGKGSRSITYQPSGKVKATIVQSHKKSKEKKNVKKTSKTFGHIIGKLNGKKTDYRVDAEPDANKIQIQNGHGKYSQVDKRIKVKDIKNKKSITKLFPKKMQHNFTQNQLNELVNLIWKAYQYLKG